jgi:branched-chain amino acid transport system permease protein
VLACAAALVYGTSTTITPAKGFEPLLTAFVVLVFGGSASLWGTLLGAYVIGLLDAGTSYWLGLQWSPVAVFLVLVLVMLFRPQGLVKGDLK